MRLFFLMALLCYETVTFAQFSNLIVFGDSLSDVGNFPESRQIWKNSRGKKELANTVAQFYVPFSNPVYQSLHNPYLATQTPIENSKNIRRYRSMSWSQYFLQSNLIAPSELLNTQKIPNTISFDYAWGYATSTKRCVNPDYQSIASCNAKSIKKARENYIDNPTEAHYSKLEIPGLFEQIKLFMHDTQVHKVSVNQNTHYAIWIGGNDLIASNNALDKDFNPLPALKFLFGGVAANTLKNISALIQFLPIDKRPRAIYVFELFNPALTPEYDGKSIGSIGNFAVMCSNFWLTIESKFFNLFSQTKIIVVPTYSWYQKSAHGDLFKSHAGEACQLDGDYPGDAIPTVKNEKSDCGGFMFWNAVHPATPMQQITAMHFLRLISAK